MARQNRLVKLEKELRSNYCDAFTLGYDATVYKRLLEKYKGKPLEIVKIILDKEYRINEPLPGFINLVDKKLVKFTLEYTVYKKCYRSFLSEQQKMVIVSLLHEYGHMTFKQIQNL